MIDDHSIDFFSSAVGLDAFRLFTLRLYAGRSCKCGWQPERDKRMAAPSGPNCRFGILAGVSRILAGNREAADECNQKYAELFFGKVFGSGSGKRFLSWKRINPVRGMNCKCRMFKEML